MAVRAKFRVKRITHEHGNMFTVRLEAQYDDTIPEDRRFYDATPSGHFEMLVNNPAAVEQLKLGKAFYIDISPASD